MVAPSRLQHICHEFRSDRRPGFVFLVLPRIGEVGDDGGDTTRGGGFACGNYDEEFHDTVVDLAGGGAL